MLWAQILGRNGGEIQTPWRGSQSEIVYYVRNALNVNRAEDDKLTDADVRARIDIVPMREPTTKEGVAPRDGWTFRMKSGAELQAAGLATGKLTVEGHPDMPGQMVVRSDGYFVQTIPKPPNVTSAKDVTVTEVDSGGDYKTVFLTNKKTGESLGSFRYEDKDPFKIGPTEMVEGVGPFLETSEGQFERQFTAKPIAIGNELFYQDNQGNIAPLKKTYEPGTLYDPKTDRYFQQQADGDIALMPREYQPGVVTSEEREFLQQPTGDLTELARLYDPGAIESPAGLLIQQPTGEVTQARAPNIDEAIAEALIAGQYETALAFQDFKNRPTATEALQAAMAYARSPADHQMISSIARGETTVAPPPAGTLQRVGPQADFLVEAYNKFRESLEARKPPAITEQSAYMERHAATLAEMEALREENKALKAGEGLPIAPGAGRDIGAELKRAMDAGDIRAEEKLRRGAGEIAAASGGFGAGGGGNIWGLTASGQYNVYGSAAALRHMTNIAKQYGYRDIDHMVQVTGRANANELARAMHVGEFTPELGPLHPSVIAAQEEADDAAAALAAEAALKKTPGYQAREKFLQEQWAEAQKPLTLEAIGNLTPASITKSLQDLKAGIELRQEYGGGGFSQGTPRASEALERTVIRTPKKALGSYSDWAWEREDKPTTIPDIELRQKYGAGVKQYAGGGFTYGDNLEVVGEEGPELVDLPPGSFVLPLKNLTKRQMRDVLESGTKGYANGGVVFPEIGGTTPPTLPFGIRQLQAGRAIAPSRGYLSRAAGLRIPSAQAFQNLAPESRDIFLDLAAQAGIPSRSFQQELALARPRGTRFPTARLEPLRPYVSGRQ